MALVVSILKAAERLRRRTSRLGLTVAEAEDWREKFLLGAENTLRSRPKDEDAVTDEQIRNLKQRIGDLVLGHDMLLEALKLYPLVRKTSDVGEARCRVSQSSGVTRYSVSAERVCIEWKRANRDAL